MRCRSWRATVNTKHTEPHPPGGCSVCWRPCHAVVEPGSTRCEDCLEALFTHPNAAIRALLLDEPDLDLEVVRHLAMDSDAGVALKAQQRLERDGQADFVDAGRARWEEDSWKEGW